MLLVLAPVESVLAPEELPPTLFHEDPVLDCPRLWLPLVAVLLLSLEDVFPVLVLDTAPVVVVAFCVVCAELSKAGATELPLWLLALEVPATELVVVVLSAEADVELCPASCTLIVQFVAPTGHC